jgi:hypothetical protein
MSLTTLRKAIAVLLVVRASTNFGKPFSASARFVVLGHLLGGIWTAVVAPLFGIAIVVYAIGLWQVRRWALPLGIGYAIWSTINVIAFPIVEGIPARFAPWMYGVFGVLGIAGPWLAVWLLARERAS